MPEGASPIVAVRCRPLSSEEKTNGAARIVKISGDKVSIHNPISAGTTKESDFNFDHCFNWDVQNNEVFKDIGEPMLRKALEGYNVSFVAHGQSSSGKSNSIMGTIDDPGLITQMSQKLFGMTEDAAKMKDYFMTVSMLEITDDHINDLINPSGRALKVRQHPQLGQYVDDMAEIAVASSEDIIRLHDQGNRIQKLISIDKNEQKRSSTMFNIVLEQTPKNGPSSKGIRSCLTFFELPASDHTSKSEDSSFISKSLNHLMQVVVTLNQGGKGNSTIYRECRLTKLLQDSFGGNSFLTLITHISPSDTDFSETFSSLKFSNAVKHLRNAPKRNENDSSATIKELRQEINRLRERLAGKSNSIIDMPDNDDVTRMEELLKDLQLAKMQTWDEKQRMSDMFLEERQHHLSNKGILDWVLDSMKKVDKEIQSKITNLQKDKERLMIEYKDKRKIVDDLKDTLQKMIVEYTKLTEEGKGNDEQGKAKVAQIHEMKENLKQENDDLKKLKQNLKDVQEKQKNEKEEAKSQTAALKGNMELQFKLEAEQREKMEKENQQTLADEIDRIKLETEQEKAELKAKRSEGKTHSFEDMLKVETELLDLKAEKSAMAIKLRSVDTEKRQVIKDLNELFKRQKEEMEIQQLQHFQTFRHYREAFEEQKAALEQRYRSLLEDSIQDAVYLSSRNQELSDENQNLKQEIAELKDKLSMVDDRPTSPP